MKIFMMVVMPLITGGALADVLRRFGVRLPGMMGGRGGMFGGGRSSMMGGGLGGQGGVQGLMKMASMFM